jgi:hypothetical protein
LPVLAVEPGNVDGASGHEVAKIQYKSEMVPHVWFRGLAVKQLLVDKYLAPPMSQALAPKFGYLNAAFDWAASFLADY